MVFGLQTDSQLLHYVNYIITNALWSESGLWFGLPPDVLMLLAACRSRTSYLLISQPGLGSATAPTTMIPVTTRQGSATTCMTFSRYCFRSKMQFTSSVLYKLMVTR